MELAMLAIAGALIMSLIANSYLYSQQQNSANLSERLQNQIADLDNQLFRLQTDAANLQNQEVNWKSEKAELQDQVDHLKSQIASLAAQIAELHSYAGNLREENLVLQSEKAALQWGNYTKQPKLFTRLGASDVTHKPLFTARSNQPRLYIEGEVWNAGDTPAPNCRLHVTLYQSDAVLNDTYIQLGTIGAWSNAHVSQDIYYYTENPLSGWSIIPEFG